MRTVHPPRHIIRTTLFASLALLLPGIATALELAGLTVTPHEQSPNLRYRRPPPPGLGARVEIFLFNNGRQTIALTPESSPRFDGRTAAELLTRGDWAWHDTPTARSNESLALPPGTMTVWSFNGSGPAWGTGTVHVVEISTLHAPSFELPLESPTNWLSAVTFLGPNDSVYPDRAIVHVANQGAAPLPLHGVRLWLPKPGSPSRILHPQNWQTNFAGFPNSGMIPPGSKGGLVVQTGRLPLAHAVVEVAAGPDLGSSETPRLWAHVRIKRETFDIGGGWVASSLGGSNTLHAEPYLRTLRRMHINAGMHQHVPGYSDTPLYDRYPLKYMNRLTPFERYAASNVLPRIHAVEFLGEPQYGGGRPVPPQEVWTALQPYETTPFPTSVTHSEERVWRLYAGLSDYPHYDAYRVSAPAPDAWGLYDRWEGQRLTWGAPLETIGDMTLSLRELNRPRAIAYWSQGAHAGWGRYGGRQRTSPTPDELRAQAYHAIAHRITSLYWFNLSLKSLVKFPDLIEPITRVNREILLMEDLLLEGDAYEFRREQAGGRPGLDLASVAGPKGALLFALDLAYTADPEEKVFRFRPRQAEFSFRVPEFLRGPADLFRLDADGVHDVNVTRNQERLTIRDQIQVAGIYVLAPAPGARARLAARHQALLRQEMSFEFDPARNPRDLETLRNLLGPASR